MQKFVDKIIVDIRVETDCFFLVSEDFNLLYLFRVKYVKFCHAPVQSCMLYFYRSTSYFLSANMDVGLMRHFMNLNVVSLCDRGF